MQGDHHIISRQRSGWCVYKPTNVKDYQQTTGRVKSMDHILPHSLQKDPILIPRRLTSSLQNNIFLLFKPPSLQFCHSSLHKLILFVFTHNTRWLLAKIQILWLMLHGLQIWIYLTFCMRQFSPMPPKFWQLWLSTIYSMPLWNYENAYAIALSVPFLSGSDTILPIFQDPDQVPPLWRIPSVSGN